MSKATIITKLVEAGHEDLAEQLVEAGSSDIDRLWMGWFSGTKSKKSPKDVFDRELPNIRKAIDKIAAALDAEVDESKDPMNIVTLPSSRQFNDQMAQVIVKYIKSKYGMTPELARGLASEIVTTTV